LHPYTEEFLVHFNYLGVQCLLKRTRADCFPERNGRSVVGIVVEAHIVELLLQTAAHTIGLLIGLGLLAEQPSVLHLNANALDIFQTTSLGDRWISIGRILTKLHHFIDIPARAVVGIIVKTIAVQTIIHALVDCCGLLLVGHRLAESEGTLSINACGKSRIIILTSLVLQIVDTLTSRSSLGLSWTTESHHQQGGDQAKMEFHKKRWGKEKRHSTPTDRCNVPENNAKQIKPAKNYNSFFSKTSCFQHKDWEDLSCTLHYFLNL
jgi:hypothetical protein